MHPIQNETTRNRLHAEWTGLLQIHARASAPDQDTRPSPFTKTANDVALNLVMTTAYKILAEVLRAYAEQEAFTTDDANPTALLSASKDALPWTEFHLINEGNQLCERVFKYQAYVSRSEAFMYIAAIENEFHRWQPFAPPTS